MPNIAIQVSITGNSALEGFSYSNPVNSNTITLFPESIYYISPVDSWSPTTNPTINIIQSGLSINLYLNFTGCCSGETFSFNTHSLSTPFNIGDTYFIKRVIPWSGTDEYLCGCFELVSSSSTSPSYTEYSALEFEPDIVTSTFIDCSSCLITHPCLTGGCCVNISIDCTTGSDITIPLTPYGCLGDNYYYQFNDYDGDTNILWQHPTLGWSIDNSTTNDSVVRFGMSFTDCPDGSNTVTLYNLCPEETGIVKLSATTCTPPPLECDTIYCIQNTGFAFDDTYSAVLGVPYNGTGYWSGQTNGYVIYYSSANTQWCLSTTLGGSCVLEGKSPCTTTCPDLCDTYFSPGICPTTTTTTTIDCSTLDFSAVFDCEVFPTTTTTTSTSTTTTTTIPPDPCSGVSISATITGYTTTTTTITPTTTTTTTISYSCNFSGDVTFSVVNVDIGCPIVKKFKDCDPSNGPIYYYTSNNLVNPSGGTIVETMVFEATVDGNQRCITYMGLDYDHGNINNITLVDYIGFITPTSYSACSVCLSSTTTTTTSTSTTTTTTLPDCDCYALITNKPVVSFSYDDCLSGTTGFTANTTQFNIPFFVCSPKTPSKDPNPVGLIQNNASVTKLNTCTGLTTGCTYPTSGYCYTFENTSISPVTVIFVNSSNLVDTQTIPPSSVAFICSKIVPITSSPNPSVSISNTGNLCTTTPCGP